MMKEKLVFVTNDDGYNSRGIQALLEVARKFGRVVAIAPETPQSGMSQAITINNPLFLREVSKGDGVEVYAFSGTPVDCVKIAFDYFLKGRKVDLALSGINHGSNSAANILYSGTMGGAIESSFYGCPAIGLSLDDHSLEADFEAAKIYSERIVRAVVEANPHAVLFECQYTQGTARSGEGYSGVPPEQRVLARGVFPSPRSSGPGVFLADGCVRQ